MNREEFLFREFTSVNRNIEIATSFEVVENGQLDSCSICWDERGFKLASTWQSITVASISSII